METLDYASEADLLRTINYASIFSGIGIHEQHMLADKCHISHRESGEIIIEQGEVADRLYMIIKGTVLVSKRTVLNEWIHVNTLGPGDIFGEIAILRSYPRTARVTTETPCTFLSVNAEDFLHIYQYFPAHSRDNIQLVIAKRLAELPV